MKKPNIIFILSDDQGSWAAGCYGNKEIITPNIDKLASEGMLFDSFFCASPVCSPARASLLTGSIPSQHGIHDWLRHDNEKQQSIEYLKGQTAYTDILAQNGYTCGLSGKWHMGNSAVPQHGFSHWYCHKAGGGPYYNAPVYKNGCLIKEEKYITTAITDDALEFIDAEADSSSPFFLYVGYTAPHSPWLNNHPKQYTDLYEDCPFESVPHLPKHKNAISLTDEVAKDERSNLIGYYAAVTAMDAEIGRILNKLDQLNISENTLVIFTADNGFSCGHHGFWGKGNGTFPINMYEESVKVPFIARMKNIIPSGSVCSALLSAYDFMPTILELANTNAETSSKLPGKSFAKALFGNDIDAHEDIVVFDEYGPNRMIRTKTKKLICRYPYGPNELYDLEKDIAEEHNLLADDCNEQLAAKLNYQLEQWFLKYVNPEIDGAREAVFGSGQINLAGAWATGEPSHSCDDYIKQHINYKPYNI